MMDGVTIYPNILPADVVAYLREYLPTLEFTRTNRGIIHLWRAWQGDNTNNQQAQALIALLKAHGVGQYIFFDDISIVRYDSGADYVDWHSDGGALLEPGCAMGLISLGATRPIEFRRKDNPASVSRIMFRENQLLVSREGLQETHEHRIPQYHTSRQRFSIVLFTHNKKRDYGKTEKNY